MIEKLATLVALAWQDFHSLERSIGIEGNGGCLLYTSHALATGGKLSDGAERRGLGRLATGVGIDLRIEHEDVDVLTPVSYTHLDVYKRQDQLGLVLKGLVDLNDRTGDGAHQVAGGLDALHLSLIHI